MTLYVDGFQIRKKLEGESDVIEILFAVTDDGRVFESEPHWVSTSFDRDGRQWSRAYKTVPQRKESADFIGRYPIEESRIVKFA